LKLKYSPKDIGGISALNTYYERITELEEKLYSDYDNNFKECNNDINKIHENLTNIIAETSGDVILYKYCEKLLMFLNKYRYEHIDVEKTLNDIQKRFTTKESSNDKCVEELISLAEKIKYSGKKYGIGIK
jgi:septation ring formation regulator EzrA